MEIMDLVDNGTFTNQQAEVHFRKLEETDTDSNNINNQDTSYKAPDTATTTRKAKETINEPIKL